jgi:hypothetical protein
MKGFSHFSPEVAEIGGDFVGGSSYREQMSKVGREQAHQQSCTLRTKAGEDITAELTEALASEAEQGYDLSKAERRMVKKSRAPRAQDPIEARLDAVPYDDEKLTGEDLRAVKEAKRESGILWSTLRRS